MSDKTKLWPFFRGFYPVLSLCLRPVSSRWIPRRPGRLRLSQWRLSRLEDAARAGRVVYVQESGFDGAHPNNLVVIDHGDSTYTRYMHLTHDGALVQLGAHVK